MDYTILNIIQLIYLYLKLIFIQMFTLYHKAGGSVPILLNNGVFQRKFYSKRHLHVYVRQNI